MAKSKQKRRRSKAPKARNVARPFTPDALLKRSIRTHFTRLGFTKANDGTLILPGSGKDVVRRIHGSQRLDRLESSLLFIARAAAIALPHFANGSEIDPTKIQLKLIRVRSDTKEAELFRFATLTWSVPVSAGFGRRLRYLVWDQGHDRLYTTDVTNPRFVWAEAGERVQTAAGMFEPLRALDLLLEAPPHPERARPADYDLRTGRINPEELGDRSRIVYLRPEADVAADDEEETRAQPGEFAPCACCRKAHLFGRSSVQDHQTTRAGMLLSHAKHAVPRGPSGRPNHGFGRPDSRTRSTSNP
jgi:hypothetical protein